MKKSQNIKVVTHVPLEYLDKVQKAVGEAGAGKEGNYINCSFILKGTGFFTPIKGANPTIGTVGKAEKVEEYHLEFTCHTDILEKVISELKKAHPYEEVPIYIFEYFEL